MENQAKEEKKEEEKNEEDRVERERKRRKESFGGKTTDRRKVKGGTEKNKLKELRNGKEGTVEKGNKDRGEP